jgi:hypothetical protein
MTSLKIRNECPLSFFFIINCPAFRVTYIIIGDFCVSGVHRYVLDDRLFARPLYSDHQNNSRCVVCHLPYTIFKSRMTETPGITLPSTLPDPEIQVSVPVGSPRSTRPSVSGNILSHKKVSRPSGRDRGPPGPRSRLQPRHFMRTVGDLKSRAPPPADSWALRYQKGVAK